MAHSSTLFAATLVIDAPPTRLLSTAVAAIYGLAAVALAWAPPIWAAIGLPVLVAGFARDRVRARRPVRLRWSGDGEWCEGAGADGARVTLAASTVVTRWLVVLALVDGQGRLRLRLLTWRALPPTVWRRLVARLRVEGPRVAAGRWGWYRARG